MELKVFSAELTRALVSRGIPEEEAARRADKLCGSFDTEDLVEIEAMNCAEEIEALAASAADFLTRTKKRPAANAGAVKPESGTANTANVSDGQTHPIPAPVNTPKPAAADDDEVFDFDEGERSSAGQGKFLLLFILTLPITLALLAVIYGAFAGVFVLIVALIIALIVSMIALSAGGAVASLIAIIYGITQLFTFVESGIYEIGLGVATAGAVIIAAVLLYNLAVRAVPVLITKFAGFVGFVTGKLRSLYYYARRECSKL